VSIQANERTARIGVVAALVVLSMIAGAALRLQVVPSKFGPDECATGDVYRYYVSVASSFLEGRGWVTDYEWNFIPPPGQAAFIVLIKLLIPGADFETLRYFQALVSILTIPLAFWVGTRMGGCWVGVAAAALLSIDRNVIDYVAILLAETNYFFLLFLFLALLLEATRRRNLIWTAAAAAVLALSALTKPFPVLLALLLPLCFILRHRDRRAAHQAWVFLLSFTLLVAPWLIRNYVRYGHLYPISTNSGTLLAQSNFLGLDSASADQIYWEQIYRRDVWKSPEIEDRFAGRVDRYGRPEWNEKDRAYGRHALGYMMRHPLHFARNYVLKLYNVLRHPLPGPGERWYPSHIYRVVLILLGLVGLAWFAVVERREPQWVLVPVLAYYLGFTALLHIVRSGRMNLPLKVLLGLFAAYLIGRLATRAWGRLCGLSAGPQLTE
jgi:4-amino-4-deoxy-L-arabinose transferase-like glycosyltransferase